VEAAKKAFGFWRDAAVEQRAGLLRRMAEIMRRRRYELAAWQVYECGKPWREADADIAEAIDFCMYYAHEAERLSRGWEKNLPGEANANLYEPRGVAVVIAPWNFPLAILTGMATAAVVTGNPVVMKPAEQSSVTGAKLMEIFEEAGAPAGVVNLLNGDGEEIGPTLVTHPDVAIIAFTGSRKVGLMIQEQSARTEGVVIKKVITELGGKNAMIIDENADLDEAVAAIVYSAFGYAGQKCSACSRLVVLESVHDALVHRLVEATRSIRIGRAEEPGTYVPPVIDAEAYARILKTIESAKQHATLAYPADDSSSPSSLRRSVASSLSFPADSGFFIEPHIFTNVKSDSSLALEEIFGPVLAIIKARDLEHALHIANATKYALTGGLFSRSPASIAKVKREFRVGNLYINRKITGALVERQPFGGFKLSGVGSKAGGPEYLLQFTWPRTITENTMRRGFAPEEPAGE
jgi:RHH-type proline utilization regulon transcriptional repressor/proline dehydrogenase/delta 1-pyrroline-5-carboxylate dehydrogenase